MSNPLFARALRSAVAVVATVGASVALSACNSNDQTYRPPAPRTTTTQPVYTPAQPGYTQPSQPGYTQPAPRPPAGPQTSCGKGKCG